MTTKEKTFEQAWQELKEKIPVALETPAILTTESLKQMCMGFYIKGGSDEMSRVLKEMKKL